MRKAFTLAEIMIVLTVIGILTVILLPIGIRTTPDENITKFKKTLNTLGEAVRELANSDNYFTEGDFGKDRNGNAITNYSYFCDAMTDILTVKKARCSDSSNRENIEGDTTLFYTISSELSTIKQKFDEVCVEAVRNHKNASGDVNGKFPGFVLSNNALIVFAEPVFGRVNSGVRVYADNNSNDIPMHADENGFDSAYVAACIEIDEVDKGEAPFGFGIRSDGKILYGVRADQWANMKIQKDG